MTTQNQGKTRRRAADGMTPAELLALPVSFDLSVSNRALKMGRTLGYDLAKKGEYPIRVFRVGNLYRVTRADLFRFLGVTEDQPVGVGA